MAVSKVINLFNLDIKNKAESNEVDIYIYGEIISGSYKWDESDVTFKDFKDTLENLKGTETLNMYVNSIGGSVFTTEGIIAMLKRAKAKGITINAYIDGLGASAASFLIMVADNIYAYNTSILMLHKPMSIAFGNADDLQEQIDLLDKLENSVMIPMYMAKVKDGVTEDQIRAILKAESWFSAEEMAEIFNITILEDAKELVACAYDSNTLRNYKHIPESIKNLFAEKPKKEVTITTETVIDTETIENEEEYLKFLKAKLKLELIS